MFLHNIYVIFYVFNIKYHYIKYIQIAYLLERKQVNKKKKRLIDILFAY